jgi:hypothetical protein
MIGVSPKKVSSFCLPKDVMGLKRPTEHPSSVGIETLRQAAVPQKAGLMPLMKPEDSI